MRQIEISNGEKEVYQTFIIDSSNDFPYYRPLYLISRVGDEKEAARAAKRNYFMNKVSGSKWHEKNKQIKVIARLANKEKDIEIGKYVTQFNEAKNISNRNVSEIAHRMAEEKIHELALNY